MIFHFLQQHNSSVLQFLLSLFLNEDELKTVMNVVKRAPMPLPNTQYVAPVTTDRKCPKCGAPLLIYTANTGAKAGMKFIVCSGFKKTCDYVERLERMEK